MRLIDADAVDIEYRGGFHDDYVVNYNSFINAPTIDAVSVVRCKDCIWSEPNEFGDLDCRCHIPTFRVNADDFCSYGGAFRAI